jgi:hypothetical protein
MTGYESKRAAARDRMLDDDDDDTQVYQDHDDALTIAYQSGYYDGKKAAQPAQEPVAYLCRLDEHGLFDLPTPDKACNDCFPVYTAPPKPAQEPVAVLFQDGSIVKYEDLEFVPEKSGQSVQMLYTAPPQRTWVGLTDEEIDQGLLRTPYAMKTAEAWREGVRWAYHQLKEKNT